jgi:hypothetical protein
VSAQTKKSREASLVRADGVVWPRNFLTTPPRPSATPYRYYAHLIFLVVPAAEPVGNVGKPSRSCEAFPSIVWESASFADFHRCGIFHRPFRFGSFCF